MKKDTERPRQGETSLAFSLNKNKIFGLFILMLFFSLSNFSFGQTISAYGGTGSTVSSGDGGLATAAGIKYPQAIISDGAGNIYFTTGQFRVRRIDAITGIITTVAGNGLIGTLTDGVQANSTSLSSPAGICFDATYNNLYIADKNHHAIRKVNMSTGIITTVAGGNLNIFGNPGYLGNGGLATAAELNRPEGVYVDATGNIYISDTQNHLIRKVTASTGIITKVTGVIPIGGSSITTYPGNNGDGGSAVLSGAKVNLPKGITADNLGNIYFVDFGNNRIRTIDVINGPGAALINAVVSGTFGSTIKGAYMLGNNDLYYSDGNSIKKYDLGLSSSSIIAGTGVSGFSGDWKFSFVCSVGITF